MLLHNNNNNKTITIKDRRLHPTAAIPAKYLGQRLRLNTPSYPWV